jgi:hypothetical protein
MKTKTEEALCPSHNSGYAVRAEYRPLPNCPTLRFGQLRIAAERCPKWLFINTNGGNMETMMKTVVNDIISKTTKSPEEIINLFNKKRR